MVNPQISTQMPLVSIAQMKQAISYFAMQLNEPLMFWGGFGIGKTRGVEQAAGEHSAHLTTVMLGQWDGVDLRGLPDRDGDRTRWLRPSTLPFKGNPGFPDDRPIILFLDELNACKPDVFGIAYQLILDRRIGEHELMDNVIIVCAGNRESDRGVTNKMPMPLNNRMMHFEVQPDAKEFVRWARAENYPEVWCAFILFREQLLHTFDPAKPAKIVSTPRTIEKAMRIWRAPDIDEDWKLRGVAASVGEGVATEFKAFLDTWSQVPDLIEKIKKDPKRAPVPNELSMQYALTIALSGMMSPKTCAMVQTYLERLPQSEMLVLAWQLAGSRDKSLYATPEFIKFAQVFKAIW